MYTENSTCITRLHPQGKGGPQAILCGRRLKSSQKSENVPTKQIKKPTIFERSAIYCSWTFDAKKCVFDTSCGTLINGKWKKWTIPKFQLFADALTVAPKNRVRGTSTRWQNFQKYVCPPRDWLTDGRTFLSTAHTKCPSGNNCWRFVKLKPSSWRKRWFWRSFGAFPLAYRHHIDHSRPENSLPHPIN